MTKRDPLEEGTANHPSVLIMRTSPAYPMLISAHPGSGIPQHAFNAVHEVPMASTLGWFAVPSSSGSRLVRTLHSDPSILGGPTQHGS